MNQYSNVIVEVNSGIGIIKINRPEVYGALTREAKFEIIKGMRQLNKDPDVRSIVLTSEGKAFCSGQDLNDRTVQADQRAVDLGNTLEQEWNPVVKAIRESKKIVIGAINGVCAGAGVSVALACDLIIAKPGVKFISGFSKLGLCPDAGSTQVFTSALGPKKALEFFLFNKPLSAEQMLEYGLINEVHEDFLDRSYALAREINQMAPLSLEMIKENIKEAEDLSYNESMQREVYAQRFLGNSNDYKEGLNAFFEKRAPQFEGK